MTNERAAAKMAKDEVTKLIADAVEAGHIAGAAAVPVPMHVIGYAPVLDGACGFAWVNVKPGNGQVAKALVAAGMARKDGYYGGVTVWISEYNQSMARKEAHARAFAAVLSAAGVRAYAGVEDGLNAGTSNKRQRKKEQRQ